MKLFDQSYFVNDEFSEIEIEFTVAKSFITERLAALYVRAQDNAAAPARSTIATVIQLIMTATSLLKLDLPKFTGKQSEWDSFQAIFTSMVKDVPIHMPTLKLQHLLRCVEVSKKSVPEYTRLLDTTNECRRGLLNLGEPINQWDRWFVSLTVFKLGETTREA